MATVPPPCTAAASAARRRPARAPPQVFRKPVDNLRTNHRGTFVLRDSQFRWLVRLSQNRAPAAVGEPFPPTARPAELAADHLALPCAIVRGAVAALGYDCAVSADASQLPQCDFTVVIQQRG